nr:Os05g0491800 [Ipomoea batatas]
MAGVDGLHNGSQQRCGGAFGVMPLRDDAVEELSAGAQLQNQMLRVLVLVGSLELHDVLLTRQVVHDLNLPPHVLNILLVHQLPLRDGLARKLFARFLVSAKVGHPELPPPQLLPDACGKDGEGTGANHEHGDASLPAQPTVAKPRVPSERYGSWMLVSRKPRKNNGRGNWPPGGQPRARQHAPPREPDMMGGGQRSQSRFAALDGLDDGMMEQYQEPDHAAPPELQQPYANLPRIRTNYRGESRQHVQSRPEPHPDYEPQMNFSKEAPPGNSPSPSLADFENTYKHDPPDSERRPPNLDDPPDIAMQETESGFDPNGLLAAGRRRS